MSKRDPEFALLAACCQWPPGPRRLSAIADAARGAIDWDRFERLVTRHRVTGLAAQGLASVQVGPATVRARLGGAALGVATAHLAMTAEALRLQRLFDAAGIRAFMVKGVAVSRLAYGEAAVKQSKDLDLVVPLEDFAKAEALLGEAGYVLWASEAPLSPEEWALALRFAKHRGFRHPSGTLVELHFRLERNPVAQASLGNAPPLQDVAMGEGSVRTLANPVLYTYLCIHGGGHAWRRLKWLADLAAFLASTKADLVQLHEGAAGRGARRASAVALALCHDELGLDVPPALLREARTSLVGRIFLVNARAALRAEGRGGWGQELMVLRERLCRMLMLDSLAYLGEEVRLVLVSESDARTLRLPPRWSFLYPLVRVPLLIERIWRRTMRG
ncbi:MAG: nucleotidyltransferase family protein [Pseudomonadota bacterium]